MSEIHSIDAEDDQFAYRYDTQLLIDKRDKDLDEDEISDYITEHFEGNSLIAAGDEDLVKIHFHGVVLNTLPYNVLQDIASALITEQKNINVYVKHICWHLLQLPVYRLLHLYVFRYFHARLSVYSVTEVNYILSFLKGISEYICF